MEVLRQMCLVFTQMYRECGLLSGRLLIKGSFVLVVLEVEQRVTVAKSGNGLASTNMFGLKAEEMRAQSDDGNGDKCWEMCLE